CGGAGRSSWREMDSGLGRRTHLRNDRAAAGLVCVKAAILGRANYRFLLRRLRETARGLCGPLERVEVVRTGRSGRVVHAPGGRIVASRNEMRLRGGRLAKRK